MNKEETQLHIAFLILEPYSGRGGTEQALITMINELFLRNVTSSLLFLHKPTYIDFLNNCPSSTKIDIASEVSTPTYIPKFFKKNWEKKQRLSQINELINNCHQKRKIDALIFIDISKQLIRSSNIIKNFKKTNPHSVIIGWPHILFNEQREKELKRLQKTLKLFDRFFAVSQGMKQALKLIYPIEKIDVVYNPIIKGKEQKRKGNNKFLYIGRLGDQYKNFPELLVILSKLSGNWHLDVYGSSDCHKKDALIQKLCQQLNIQNKITFYGWIDKPWNTISTSSLLLLNSTYETFGLVLAEAMAHGIPCISTDCPVGPREIIKSGVNGWLVKSPEEYREKLQAILDNNLKLPDPNQVAASVAQFSSKNVANNFKDYLIRTLKNKKTV